MSIRQGNILVASSTGITDYKKLNNKPSIDSIELVGNKTSDDLNLQKKLTVGNGISISDDNVISVTAAGGVTSVNGQTGDVTIEAVKNQNTAVETETQSLDANLLKIWSGTKEQYDAITSKDPNTIYYTESPDETSEINADTIATKDELNSTKTELNEKITAETTRATEAESTITTNVTNLTNQVNTLSGNVVDKTSAQEISGQKAFTAIIQRKIDFNPETPPASDTNYPILQTTNGTNNITDDVIIHAASGNVQRNMGLTRIINGETKDVALCIGITNDGNPYAQLSFTPAISVNTNSIATTAFSHNLINQSANTIYQDMVTLSSGSINLVENKSIYSYLVNADTTFNFITTGLPNIGTGRVITFELYLQFGATANTITWPTSVKWLEDTVPTFEANTFYLLAFRTFNNGTNWIGNPQCNWK